MKRRKYLFTAGVAITSVGCMEHGNPVATLHPQSGNGSENTYASLETERLITAESLIGEVPWAYITVSNNTEYDQGQLELSIKFYDENQSVLQQQSPSIAIFPGKAVWTTFQPATTPNRDRIASIDANIKYAKTGMSVSSPDSVSIEQSRLTGDAGTGVSITGTLSTESYSGELRLVGLVYDSQDRFRGTVSTTSKRLNSGERWEFDASNPAIRTPVNQSDPDSYDLRVERLEG